MKKVFLMFAVAGMFAFASCDSPRENAAEENAEQMEEAADDADAPVLEEQADDMEDSLDAVDPQ